MLYGVGAIALGSCSDSEPLLSGSEPESAPYSISISVESNSGQTTRTSVADPDGALNGKQHVTRVQLYILKELADGDYEFVATEDIKWNYLEGAMQGLDSRRKSYRTRYQGYEDDTYYKFIAFGFDDTYTGTAANPLFDNANSVKAFGAPDEIIGNDSKLSDKDYLSLRDGVDVNVLNKSEMFAGSQTYLGSELKGSKKDNDDQPRTIELYRRVAGVIGYFKKLPKEIEGREVASVVVRTCRPQNTQTYFLPKLPVEYSTPEAVPDNLYKDYITSPSKESDSDIIARYDVNREAFESNFTLSAYLLPMAGSEEKGISTLYLDILDEEGNILTRRYILYSPNTPDNGTRSGTGIIDDAPDNTLTHYPIRANQLYRMGTDNDRIDLSGETAYITIMIDPVWDEYYGGTLDYDGVPGLGIDNSWGEHEGGALDKKDE